MITRLTHSNSNIINFLYINRDFFAASLTSATFQTWGESVRPQLLPLSNDLHKALNDSQYVAEFRLAICGDASGLANSLMSNSFDRIIDLLEKQKKLGNALARHVHDPIIKQWYDTQATPLEVQGKELRIVAVRIAKQTFEQEQEKAKAQAKADAKAREQAAIDKKAMKEIALYTRASKKYLKHLDKQIAHEPKHLDKTTLNPIHTLLLQKRNIFCQGVDTLSNENINPAKRILSFRDLLIDNKKTLMTRRDSAFVTFAKGLGVFGATIFGMGIGGYIAYQRFFGNHATKSSVIINKVNETSRKFEARN